MTDYPPCLAIVSGNPREQIIVKYTATGLALYFRKGSGRLRCISLLLVDDHALMRQALRQQLEEVTDLVIVAEADTRGQVAELAQITAAEVAIVDIELVIDSGIEACQPMLTDSPQPKIVFLSTAD